MTEEQTEYTPDNAGEALNAVSEESAPQISEDSTGNSQGGVQKRISKVIKQRNDARTELAYYKGQLEAIKSAGVQPKQEVKEAPKASKPKKGDYQDYDQYIEDLADFKADEKAKAAVAQIMDQRKQADAQAQQLEAQNQLKTEIDKGKALYNDFDEVALSSDHAVNQHMIDAARGEQLSDVLYYLGKNHAESNRIAALPRELAFKEIAKIETKLTTKTQPKTKETTKAPPPVTTVGGGKAASNITSTKDMNFNQMQKQWEKNRLEKLGVR